MFNLFAKVKKMATWQILLFTILASEILTAIVVVIVETILLGQVTYDYLLTGIITSFIVALIVAYGLIRILKQTGESESEERIRDKVFLSSIGEGVVALDQYDKIIFINEAALKMVRITEAEAMRNPWFNGIIQGEDEGGKPVEENCLRIDECYFRRPDGSRFAVHVTGTPVVINNKKIGTIIVFRDISREKEIDRAKSEFISLTAHQLKDPLAVMRWYNEVLMESQKLSPDDKEKISTIYKTTLNLIDLVDALLNVTRIELGKFTFSPSPVDLEHLIDDINQIFSDQYKWRKIKIEKIIKDNTFISTDVKAARLILQNLLSNAFKYTAQINGLVKIEIKRHEQGLLVAISDNGIAIAPEDQPKIFGRFFRSTSARVVDPGGTGLGLYMSKLFVEKLGGRIWFVSEEGRGTTFYLYLPDQAGNQK